MHPARVEPHGVQLAVVRPQLPDLVLGEGHEPLPLLGILLRVVGGAPVFEFPPGGIVLPVAVHMPVRLGEIGGDADSPLAEGFK